MSDECKCAPCVVDDPSRLLTTTAEICHEANRLLCRSIGDDSQVPWVDAPEWQRESAIEGVRFVMANPRAGDAALHEKWMRDKERDGWTYGPVKDAEKKLHPCIVAFAKLPKEQQRKDALFRAIALAMTKSH